MTELRPNAIPTKQLENERFIVTEWRFPPQAETGWHRHEHDYVVVPQSSGKLLLEMAEGNKEALLEAGQSYSRQIGVEHNVINPNDFEFTFIEIEAK